MSLTTFVMEQPIGYRLWQAPFAEQKLAPLLRHNDMATIQRVLDVGCGPGTNTHHFARADYLGIDINQKYIDSARRRHGRTFVVADVTKYRVTDDQRFDCILVNSFLHHVATPDVERILAHLASLLTPDGHVHILDLVLPPSASISRLLARWDRGEFPRPLNEWERIFASAFGPIVFEPYTLTGAGIDLWSMVYFKGRART
jgi:ubiquinone/menaquinone biosynthesis C-methylase UbiE